MIGIITAMEKEMQALAIENARTETVGGIRFVRGTVAGKEVAAAVCGVGKVFAAICAEAMILKFGVTALLNTGVAGGLSPMLEVGDVVVADEVVQHDMNTTALGDPRGLLSGINVIKIKTDKRLTKALCEATAKEGLNGIVGTVASGDLFVADTHVKEKLVAEFDAVACEMEGAAIGHVAFVNGVPFAVLRAISDGGDGMEFSEFVGLAAKISVAVTKEFLNNLS